MIQRNPRNDTFERVTALRLTGMTYAQISEAVGVSKQRVGQICGKRDVTKFRRISRESVKFDGLRNWMNDNHFSMLELCRRLYGDCGGNYMNNLRQKTSGKIDMKKSDIDKLLDITELTYEELFAEVSV